MIAIPILLLILGAVLGGLKSLLQSSTGKHPTITDDSVHQRLSLELERRPNLARASGLARMFLVIGAAFLFTQYIQDVNPTATRVLVAICITLIAGLLLEGIPSLVLRNRGCHLVMLSLPIARAADWCMRPLTFVIDKILQALDAEEIEADDGLSASEQRMIGRLFELGEADVAKAMTPRTELTAVEKNANLLECLEIMNHAGHSRVPVYGDNLDDILGIAYMKDIMSLMTEGDDLSEERIQTHLRTPYFIPETKSVSELLDEMRSKRVHLAIAVDEYGGTAGVISIEDIIEEIVGEIQDEHDEQELQAQVVHLSNDKILVEGKMALSDLNELLEIKLPDDEDYDTVAGLLFDRLGHIPEIGEQLELNGTSLKVINADERRIWKIEISATSTNAK